MWGWKVVGTLLSLDRLPEYVLPTSASSKGISLLHYQCSKTRYASCKNRDITTCLYCFTMSDYSTFVYSISCHIFIRLRFLLLLKVQWCVRHSLMPMIHWWSSWRSAHPRACQTSSNPPDWTQSGSGICTIRSESIALTHQRILFAHNQLVHVQNKIFVW